MPRGCIRLQLALLWTWVGAAMPHLLQQRQERIASERLLLSKVYHQENCRQTLCHRQCAFILRLQLHQANAKRSTLTALADSASCMTTYRHSC